MRGPSSLSLPAFAILYPSGFRASTPPCRGPGTGQRHIHPRPLSYHLRLPLPIPPADRPDFAGSESVRPSCIGTLGPLMTCIQPRAQSLMFPPFVPHPRPLLPSFRFPVIPYSHRASFLGRCGPLTFRPLQDARASTTPYGLALWCSLVVSIGSTGHLSAAATFSSGRQIGSPLPARSENLKIAAELKSC
ncbi:hypothetical protein B0H14DRAFT_249248 [Mycena olivaceomarginata]|nr:hypothetical protein B0H14DRAFT_249248 [Mycena olivaceomarginata]